MTTTAIDYPALVARCRRLIAEHTGPTDVVAVISRGDAALADVAGRNVVQFPADETGRWMGFHPADGTAALALLDAARRRGVNHLVVPSTSSWWFEHYAEFAEWLHDHGMTVAGDDATAVVIALPAPDSDGHDEPPSGDPGGVDGDPARSPSIARFRSQTQHLVSFATATLRPGAGLAGIRVVSPDDDGDAGPGPTTHLIVPEELDRLAPERARRAHRRGARHRLLIRRDGLGAVYLIADVPAPDASRLRRP